MFQDVEDLAFRAIGLMEVVGALTVAFVCGFTVSLVYRWTYRGTNYSASFVRSMIFLAMITAVVMIVIGNNLARAFGLVGAMSIIRFRTAVKDPQDIVFIFFALAAGLAAGVGLYMVAIVGTVCISAVILVMGRSNYAALHRQSFLLNLSYDAAHQNGEASYVPVLNRYCKRYNLVNVRSAHEGHQLDLTFFVDLRRKEDGDRLTRALSEAAHVRHVNLYFDSEENP